MEQKDHGRMGRRRLWARNGGILTDPVAAPPVYLDRRQNGDLFGSSALSSPSVTSSTPKSTDAARPTFFSTASAVASTDTGSSSIVSPSSTSASSANSPSSSIVTAPSAGSSLPQPFDGGLGNNFTQPSCPTFINAFLRNESFTSCLPFSMLLQNSMSFFQASKSESSIVKTLDATCNVVFPSCSSLMSSLGQQLRSSSNCGNDYDLQNPTVRQAYNGLIAYNPLYSAGCAKDDQHKYCFANAITNSTSPSDSYIYYLPLGVSLPGGSGPTCSACLRSTMAAFHDVASNKSQPLNMDYAGAAQMIDLGCGPGFVNETVPRTLGSGKSSGASTGSFSLILNFCTVLLVIGIHHLI